MWVAAKKCVTETTALETAGASITLHVNGNFNTVSVNG